MFTGFEPSRKSYMKIQKAVHSIELFPEAGGVPPELEVLNLTFYRQVIAGLNRMIYEIRGQFIYIHLICDTSKDMGAVLARRLVRQYAFYSNRPTIFCHARRRVT